MKLLYVFALLIVLCAGCVGTQSLPERPRELRRSVAGSLHYPSVKAIPSTDKRQVIAPRVPGAR